VNNGGWGAAWFGPHGAVASRTLDDVPGSRRRYSADQKEAAVRLVVDGGRTAAAAARELGLSQRSVASWVRAHRVERQGREWSGRVRKHFDFLAGYGFALTGVEASLWWEVSVTYRSPASAVAVIYSMEFARVEVELMRLVDGELPAYPVFLVDSVPLNTFLADELLTLRAGANAIPKDLRGLTEPEVEIQLAFWARALREHGRDFLAGDLRVLDELERRIRERVRRHRQEVVVWLPDTASDEEAADAAERLRAGTPDGVAITTRRYRRRSRGHDDRQQC
jgi:hypothetical protein